MDTKNEQSVGQTHEKEQSQGVAAVAAGSAFLCGHTTGTDAASGQRSHNDFITFDEIAAKAHVAKYKGSWSEEGWYVRLPILPNGRDQRRPAPDASST